MVERGYIPRDAGCQRIHIDVRPFPEKVGNGLVLVSFEDEPEKTFPAGPRADAEGDETQRRQLETSNEELKGANEEVAPVNEEFQSTNEELETSKEGLQSLNEELNTGSTKLQQKVEELEKNNNVLANLLRSTDIAILFLDTELRIRRFTPATQRVLNFIPADMGRPITDVSLRVRDAELINDVLSVLEDVVPVEREVEAEQGQWYIRRVLPYRTHENKIEGVVVTFSNVTDLKQSSQDLDKRARQQRNIAELAQYALEEPDLNLVSERALKVTGGTLGVPYLDLFEYLPDRQELILRAAIGWSEDEVGRTTMALGRSSQGAYVLRAHAAVIVDDFELETRFSPWPRLVERGVVSGVCLPIHSPHGPCGILGVYTPERLHFSEDDVTYLRSVAHVLALAIERKRIYDNLNVLNETLEERVEERTAAVELLQRVAVIANEAESVDDAFRETMSLVCQQMGWAVGHAYLPRDEAGKRRWTDSGIWWPPSSEELDTLIRVSRETSFRTGEGTVGRAAKSRRPESIYDVRHDPGFVRVSKKQDLGVASTHAIPVLVGNVVVAVLEFFSTEVLQEREGLHETLSQLGVILGRIVERKRSELHYRAVVEDQTECICRFDAQGKLAFVNESFARLWGESSENLKGTTLFSLFPKQAGREFRRHVQTLSADQPVTFVQKLPAVGGVGVWQEWTVRALVDEGGQILEYQGVGRDITRRRNTEERLRLLTAELIAAEEEERRRLSGELHDDLNQRLVTIAMTAETMSRDLPLPEKQVRDGLIHLKEIADSISDRIHWLAYELHPPVLDDIGVGAALKSHGKQLADRHGFQLKVTNGDMPDDLARDISTCLFRVGQQALSNAAAHSKSDRVEVRVFATDRRVHVSVQDYGIGFDREEVRQRRAGLGLRSMEERVRLLGGSISIQSAPGKGTRVDAWLPYGNEPS